MAHTSNQPLILILFGLLVGCASPIPSDIRQSFSGAPSVGQVRNDINAKIGQRVRWGGSIAAVENMESDTWIQVVSRQLDYEGEPQESDVSDGRFLARINGFLDPAIYAVDRDITVTGTLEPGVRRKLGEYVYLFPVVHVTTQYLWPRRPEYDRQTDRHAWGPPLWYPWYGYPWGYSSPYWW